MQNPKELTLKLSEAATKPNVSRPNSSPIALQGIDLSSIEGSFPLSQLPPLPLSPPPPGMKDHSSSPMLDAVPRPQAAPNSKEEDDKPSSSVSKIYHLRQVPGSTPELSLVDNGKTTLDGTAVRQNANASQTDKRLDKSSYSTSPPPAEEKRKDKTFRNPLGRSKSIRKESHSSSSKPNGIATEAPPRSPPAAPDRAAPDRPGVSMLTVKNKDKRAKSTERVDRSNSDDNIAHAEHAKKSAFFTSSKNAFSKAKTGGGNFLNKIGKIGRSGSSTEKETHVPEEAYVIHIINKPLVEQTRITRISKSLDACKDKTEYWMSSLPWRCIE